MSQFVDDEIGVKEIMKSVYTNVWAKFDAWRKLIKFVNLIGENLIVRKHALFIHFARTGWKAEM